MTLAVSRQTSGLADLVDLDAELRVIADGFAFTEGPAWSPAEGVLRFSDIPGNTRWRWNDSDGAAVDLHPTNKANGMVHDREGRLLVCEHASSCLVRFGSDGSREVIADRYQGMELNSPNDVITRSDGSIYFSDPAYGRSTNPTGNNRPPSPLGFRGVFRIPPGGGEPVLVVARDEFDQPNGLCFSPDESILYIDDLPGIKAFDVSADGSLGPARVLRDDMGTPPGAARNGAPDGMRCDELGNVWCGAHGGVWVLDPAGEVIGIIETPEVCANLTWGGADLHTLFLTTSTSVRALRTRVGPTHLPYH
jgi:sugar lactone lactonase YvrE